MPKKPRARTGLEVLVDDEPDASFYQGAQRVNARTSAPEALYRVGFKTDPGTPEAMARQYLQANAALLQSNGTARNRTPCFNRSPPMPRPI